MAMKAMRCPQCGSELEFDDSKEFGFCSSCGTKIMLNETVHVKHSGTVKMDNSDQAKNRLELADRAFQSGNYKEAGEYYTRVLEDMPNNITVLYRKGICAIYESTAANIRTSELEVALSVAKEKWDREWASLSQLEDEDVDKKENLLIIQSEEAKELAAMLTTGLSSLGTRGSQLLSKEACEIQVSKWISLINLYNKTAPFISNEKVLNDSLLEIIDFCDAALRTNVSYKSGVAYDKNNRAVDQYSRYHLSNQTKDYIQSRRNEFAEKFNNLSFKQQTRTELDNRIQELQSKINELTTNVKETTAKYKTAKTNFWNEHPDIKKNKINMIIKFIGIGLGELIGGFILSMILIASLDLGPLFGLAMWIAIIVACVFIIKTGFGKAKSLENEVFSTDVKTIGDALSSYKSELETKQSELEVANKEMKEFLASLR